MLYFFQFHLPLSLTNPDLVHDTLIPELGQHLQHVDTDLLRIIIQTGADDAKAIWRQYPAMQLVSLVLLVLLFDICFIWTSDQLDKLEFVSIKVSEFHLQFHERFYCLYQCSCTIK